MYILKTIKTIKDINYNYINTPFNIEKENKKECFDEFFRLNNSLKYCNGFFYSLINKSDQIDYKEWFNIENYARCGGDMW